MPVNPSLYPPDWNEIAFAAKRRSRWMCDCCGAADDPVAGVQLGVHHLDYNPELNAEWNLAVLCRTCHLAVHAHERRYDPNRPEPPRAMYFWARVDVLENWWRKAKAAHEAGRQRDGYTGGTRRRDQRETARDWQQRPLRLSDLAYQFIRAIGERQPVEIEAVAEAIEWSSPRSRANDGRGTRVAIFTRYLGRLRRMGLVYRDTHGRYRLATVGLRVFTREADDAIRR